ncbi:MAG: DUF3169 family protein [Staphylococcus simulans]|nr:DUF3169 family protein [Staphylococcus simulans]
MDSTTIINLLIFIFLIALTTVFVGSEFALVKVRATKIEEMVAEGNGSAAVVKKMISNLDYYLSACQLGITVTSLGLGWLGEPVFSKLLHPIFELIPLPDALNTTISIVISFLVVTYLHVVLGELAPKTFAIQHTEKVALLYARPLYYFGLIMKPLIWLMNGSARMIIRLFGIDPDENNDAMSEEEIKMIINNSYNSGEINQTELAYMQNIFSFDERQAKDVMVPRTQMVTLNEPFTVDELLETLKEYQFTRYPITEDGDKDHIKGFINVKEFLTEYASGKPIKIANYIHELPLISETTRISDALIRMQRERVHISLVIDEYGGTAGILTMEDILEEIVGEIRDEFDDNEVNDVIKLNDDTYQINGRVLLEDLTDQLGIEFDDSEDIDTIGGWLQAHNTNLQKNDYVDTYFDRWIISDIENHQIITVILKYEYNAERQSLSEEDEVLGDHYDTLFNRKFFNASVLSHLSTFVALANIILVTTFKFANNHWEVSVIPFLISSIFSVMFKIYLPKLDSRLPNPNDEQYVDKMMKAMDEGERYVTFSAIFKLFQYNLLALTILVLVLAFYSAITGHTQSLALTLLFILFVFNVSFYYVKIYKYYKSK